MTRAIVIGAGIGGLSAALELRARGVEVTVLEARDEVGGKAGAVMIDGVEADTGPSVLTLPEIFRRVFATAGARLEDELELLQPSPAFRYVYPHGVSLDIHHAPQDTLQSVESTLGSTARRELEAFLAYAERIWMASADTFVFGEAPSFGSVVKFGLRGVGQILDIDATRSMAKAIEARVKTPELRDLLLRYATYNGSNPYQAPATLNCIAHVELALGGFGIKGGIRKLVDALYRVALRNGVEVFCGSAVSEILVEGGRAVGVRLEGGATSRADVIVANADPQHVFRHLLPPALGRKLESDEAPSTSGWTAILRARRDPRRAPHTVLFPETYRDEFVDMFERGIPPRSPTVYLCDQEACHRREGWPDAAPVFVMANAPAEPAPGRAAAGGAERFADLEAAVRARLLATGLAGEDEPFVWRRTPAELAEIFPGSRGALYGAASNSTFSAFRRPPNRLPKPRGLYLASGGAHPGGGLPLCAASGRAAAHAALEDLGVGVPA